MDPLPEEPPRPEPAPGVPPEPSATVRPEERNWALIAHLSALAFHIMPPFGHILGPLLVWLFKRQTSAFVDDQAKEALNWQISVSIYGMIAGLLIFAFVGFVLLPLLYIADVVFIILGAVAANEGKRFRYPFNLRLVK